MVYDRGVHEDDDLRASLRADAMVHVGQVAAGVAHELRNPLSVMETSVFLLSERFGQDPDAARHLRRITEQLRVAGAIVNDLLDTVRGTATPAATEDLDLRRAVREAVSWVARPPHVSVALGLPAEAVTVRGDARKLRQVVVNLVTNAVHFAARGDDPRVDVTLSREGSVARVVVRDRGPGIPPSMRARLFEPFATAREGGHGLGLALSRQIVEDHRGTLAVGEDDAGPGACFVLSLPVEA